jgi:hypothetical protein
MIPETPMDYSKSGGHKGGGRVPRGPDHAHKGAPKATTPPRETKADLLVRMKAAARPTAKDPKG